MRVPHTRSTRFAVYRSPLILQSYTLSLGYGTSSAGFTELRTDHGPSQQEIGKRSVWRINGTILEGARGLRHDEGRAHLIAGIRPSAIAVHICGWYRNLWSTDKMCTPTEPTDGHTSRSVVGQVLDQKRNPGIAQHTDNYLLLYGPYSYSAEILKAPALQFERIMTLSAAY